MSTGFILFTGSRDTVGMHIYCPEIQIAQVDFYTDFQHNMNQMHKFILWIVMQDCGEP